jgi:hypothetical protein
MTVGRFAIVGVFVTVAAAACGGGGASSPAAPAEIERPFSFKASLVDPALVDFILPLGNLNPPGHTLPTDHIYFYVGFLRPEIRGVPVFAPGDGVVQIILRSAAPDVKLFVRVNSTFMYYVDHVVLDPAIREGASLTAGQLLGTSSTGGFGVDLGVINAGLTHFFVTPARYPSDTLHADAPLKYYEEPLKSQLYAMVRRDGVDKDGRVDFDVAGRLQGNWFHESLPVSESANSSGWTRHLAFVFDNVQPSRPRVSIGGTLSMTGVFGIDGADPAFDSVTPDSGLVRYRLHRSGGLGFPEDPQILGTLLVQLIDATHLRVEAAAFGTPAAFSSAAQTYIR